MRIDEICPEARTIGISGHIRPDGDCIGSCMGMYLYLKKKRPQARMDVFLQTIPANYRFIQGVSNIRTYFKTPVASYDLFIALDCSKDRLGDAEPFFDAAAHTVNIDHHISNKGTGDENYIVPTASSACELVYDVIDQDAIDRDIAEALYTGMVADTGVFRYSSTSPKTMRIAASLMEHGFDFSALIDHAFYEKTYLQNQILGRALLESMPLLDGRCIVSAIDRKTMDLPYGQDNLITALAAVNKNTIYVNISGNAVSMPWKKQVPAIMQGWFLGSEAGKALAAVLVGDANPGGKLPFTWYESLKQVGAHSFGEEAFPGVWRNGEKKIIDEEYKEGIYVGYRWTDKQKLKPTFAFGHGLSYTTFKVSNLRAENTFTAAGIMTFRVDVTNTGNRAGTDVVQLYISDVKSSVDRPVKELKAFQKVFLKPGETKTITLKTDKRALSFWDEVTNDWKAEPGEFIAQAGDASDNLTCKLKFTLVEN